MSLIKINFLGVRTDKLKLSVEINAPFLDVMAPLANIRPYKHLWYTIRGIQTTASPPISNSNAYCIQTPKRKLDQIELITYDTDDELAPSPEKKQKRQDEDPAPKIQSNNDDLMISAAPIPSQNNTNEISSLNDKLPQQQIPKVRTVIQYTAKHKAKTQEKKQSKVANKNSIINGKLCNIVRLDLVLILFVF